MAQYAARKIAGIWERGLLSREKAEAALRLFAAAPRARGAMAPPQPIPGGAERGARLQGSQRERDVVGQIAEWQLLQMWRRQMHRCGRDPDITLAALLRGEPLSALDRRARGLKGWAGRELEAGLSLFYELWFGQAEETKLDISW